MNRSRILFIHQRAGGGGASTCLFNLVNYIKNDGEYEPIIIFGQPGPFEVELRKKQVKTYIVKIPSIGVNSHTPKIPFCLLSFWLLTMFPSIINIIRIIKKEKIKIVHINSSVLIACTIASYIGRVTIVWHVRELIPNSWLGKIQKRMINIFANRIIAISREVAKQFKKQKTILIHDGIDPDKFQPDSDRISFRNKFGLHDNEKIFSHIGQITTAKGSFIFLKAAKLLVDSGYNAKFFVIGGPKNFNEYYFEDFTPKYGWIKRIKQRVKTSFGVNDKKKTIRELKNLAERLGISKTVIFTGFQPHEKIPNFIDLSDAVVAPHIVPEPFGLVLIEPAALKKPVISTNIPPTPEIVKNGITGILVEPNNVEALSEAMKFLFDNPSRAKSMGENGYLNIKKNFHLDQTHSKVLKLYEEILGGYCNGF